MVFLSASPRNSCPVASCELSGGHAGRHEDEEGDKLVGLHIMAELNSRQDGDSSSSEELLPAEENPTGIHFQKDETPKVKQA